MNDAKVNLLGRVLISGEIVAKTGLHVGGSPGALAIGNVDMPVIRNERNNQPYIPGSSLKGKMRSLCEKLTGAPQNTTINKGKQDGSGRVEIHSAKTLEQYDKYWVNPIFGAPGDLNFAIPAPSRLIVRDVPLSDNSCRELLAAKTDMPFTEVKWEAAIDRITSAATPRQIERVPAGAVFAPMELVFSLYLSSDIKLLEHLLTALRLVEDDYLGGHGSRGSGQIAFQSLNVAMRFGANYQPEENPGFNGLALPELWDKKGQLFDWINEVLAR